MRTFLAILLSAICITSVVRADEKIPVLKVGDEVYTNVTVTGVSETEIFFTSPRGMGNAKLKNLEPAMQRHFHYDVKKASAVEQQRKIANGEFLFRIANATNRPPENSIDLKAEMDDATARVIAIVNQPVKQTPETPGMHSGHWEYWFHQGATKPDFNTVDIRATRETPYAKFPYVTCDLNPGIAFFGDDLEFNSMTKYFYTDRSLPKKKLTEEEMLEINRLYRIIGQDEDSLSRAAANSK